MNASSMNRNSALATKRSDRRPDSGWGEEFRSDTNSDDNRSGRGSVAPRAGLTPSSVRPLSVHEREAGQWVICSYTAACRWHASRQATQTDRLPHIHRFCMTKEVPVITRGCISRRAGVASDAGPERWRPKRAQFDAIGEPIATPIMSPEITSSTRRFSCRPAEVSLEATGCVFPKPLVVTELTGIPCWTR
jgi:hypothetical protein